MNKDFTISQDNQFLDCYGSTKDEVEWTPSKKKCFRMTQAEADTRIKTIQKYWPSATVIEI